MSQLSDRTLRWRNRLAVWAISFFGAMSPRFNRLVGNVIGWLLFLLPNQNKHVTRINLHLCFPNKSDTDRQELTRQSLIELGKGTAEVAFVWQNPKHALALIRQSIGEAPLFEAFENKQPIVILAPHLGCWELLNYWLSTHFTMHILYSPSGLERVDELIANSREAFDTTAHPATKRGVAGLIRTLKQGSVTAILPDQVPDRSSTHFAPFFGYPAATPSLACRLIQRTNAKAFVCFAKRLPGALGYDIIIHEAQKDIYSDDLDLSLTAMNQSLETLIMEAPEQYLWSYKRFRRRRNKELEPNPYQ